MNALNTNVEVSFDPPRCERGLTQRQARSQQGQVLTIPSQSRRLSVSWVTSPEFAIPVEAPEGLITIGCVGDEAASVRQVIFHVLKQLSGWGWRLRYDLGQPPGFGDAIDRSMRKAVDAT